MESKAKGNNRGQGTKGQCSAGDTGTGYGKAEQGQAPAQQRNLIKKPTRTCRGDDCERRTQAPLGQDLAPARLCTANGP